MNMHPALVFVAGLVIILLGAEVLLVGASRIAVMLGIKPIIIGLTIVSIGTSAPELAVGITAVLEGRGPLAVGNIAGTNIFNILFILGMSAMIRPLTMHLLSIKFDVPVMIVVSFALILIAWDGVISSGEGMFLIAAAVVYTIALIRLSRKESEAMHQEFAEEFGAAATLPRTNPRISRARLWTGVWSATLLVAGMALTVLGADLLVKGAIEIARIYGVTDAIIGLTIVAIGTSAPELATTMVATLKNDRDVAIGNLIGSSIYNVLIILGLTCAVSPSGVVVSQDVLWIDLPLAAAVAIACFPVFKSGRIVSRWEGAAFVTAYIVYFTVLVLYRA